MADFDEGRTAIDDGLQNETDRLLSQHGGIHATGLDARIAKMREGAPDAVDVERAAMARRAAGGGGGAAGGGAAAGTGDAVARSGHVSGQATPAATPQRDDPDDGDHTSSKPQEPVAEDAQAGGAGGEAVSDGAAEDAAGLDAVQEQAHDTAEDDAMVWPGVGEEPEQVSDTRAGTEVTLRLLEGEPDTGAVYQERTRFTFPGSGAKDHRAGVQLKTFPLSLVDRLKDDLARMTNEAFAEQLSAAAVISAFILAQLGGDTTGYDANTVTAVQAFRRLDQRLGAVEDAIGQLDARTRLMAKDITHTRNQMGFVSRVLHRLEFVGAFLVKERISPDAHSGVTPSQIDITEEQYRRVRDRIRTTADAERAETLRDEGRPRR